MYKIITSPVSAEITWSLSQFRDAAKLKFLIINFVKTGAWNLTKH